MVRLVLYAAPSITVLVFVLVEYTNASPAFILFVWITLSCLNLLGFLACCVCVPEYDDDIECGEPGPDGKTN